MLSIFSMNRTLLATFCGKRATPATAYSGRDDARGSVGVALGVQATKMVDAADEKMEKEKSAQNFDSVSFSGA